MLRIQQFFATINVGFWHTLLEAEEKWKENAMMTDGSGKEEGEATGSEVTASEAVAKTPACEPETHEVTQPKRRVNILAILWGLLFAAVAVNVVSYLVRIFFAPGNPWLKMVTDFSWMGVAIMLALLFVHWRVNVFRTKSAKHLEKPPSLIRMAIDMAWVITSVIGACLIFTLRELAINGAGAERVIKYAIINLAVMTALASIIAVIAKMRQPVEKVVVYHYSKIIYLWPLMAMGLVFWPIDYFGWLSPTTESWIAIIVLVTTIMTVGIDIGRNGGGVWLIFCAMLGFAYLWRRVVSGVTWADKVFAALAALPQDYPANLFLIVSLILLIPFLLTILRARVNDRWVITNNTVEHISLGRSDISFARVGKTFNSEYPDMLELLTCLSGTLVISDSIGRNKIASIENVFLVFWKRYKIDKLLQATLVTVNATEAADIAAIATAEAESHDQDAQQQEDSHHGV